MAEKAQGVLGADAAQESQEDVGGAENGSQARQGPLPASVVLCAECGTEIPADHDFCPTDSDHRGTVPYRRQPDFPLLSYREAATHLRRPFTPEAVRWKVQAAYGDKGCLVVGYIDARLVIERLNLVIPDLWLASYEPTNAGMWCHMTVDGITRSDIGDGQGKAAVSDSLKRAGVHFGLGVSVYAIPRAELWASDPKHKPYFTYRKTTKGNKQVHEYRLTPEGESALRERYRKWLDVHGAKAFGEPLDHGDVEDSAGEPDQAESADPSAETGPVVIDRLVDQKADELRMICREFYEQIKRAPDGKTRLTPAQFNQQLEGASGSHKDLAEYRDFLQHTLAELNGAES